MTEILTEILINASKDKVWETLTDFSAYPQWNPFLVEVKTELRPGAPVALRAKVLKRIMNFDSKIVTADTCTALVWAGPISKVKSRFFRGEHYFKIQEISDSQIRFIHGERFFGLLMPL